MRTYSGLRALRSQWTVVVPLIALVALALSWGRHLPVGLVAVVALCLAGAVLAAVHMVLLVLTVVVGALTVAPGRATLLQGGVHVAIFAAFVFLAISP